MSSGQLAYLELAAASLAVDLSAAVGCRARRRETVAVVLAVMASG